MNKPPERLMEGKPGQRIVYIGNGFLPSYEDFQRAFILEEEKPMTQKTENIKDIKDGGKVYADWDRIRAGMQKTENLTTQEAWAAMARGECVKSCSGTVRRINRIAIEYYEEVNAQWFWCDSIGMAPYFIVLDPSKPKEVKSNYQEQVMAIDAMLKRGEYKNAAACILTYVDSLYLRKP